MSIPDWVASYLPDPNLFGVWVAASCVLFPILHSAIRLSRKKTVTLGSVISRIILGFSAPAFLFLALSPLNVDLLKKVSDQGLILCMAGIIGLAVCAFALFDSDS